VPSGELDDECHHDREDHGEAGECGRVHVDVAEALVASVAARDRIRSPAEMIQVTSRPRLGFRARRPSASSLR
jgi:hypothetical protein